MLENVRLSLQGIWSHKMRSFLTMLGIIIGIASIIAIVSTIQGSNEQLKSDLIGAGNNAVKVTLFQGDDTYEFGDYSAVPKGVPVISEAVRQEVESLDEVEKAALYTRRSYTSSFYQDVRLTGNIMGVTNDYFDVTSYVISSGRLFVQDDYDKYRKVVILDKTAANSLFYDENPIGKTIEIGKQPFTVIGVVQEQEAYAPRMSNIEDYYEYMGNLLSGVVYMPIDTWPVIFDYDEPQNLIVKAATTDDMSAAGKKSAEVLNKYLTVGKKSDVKYKSENALDTEEAQEKLKDSTNTQLIWIASISLLVGGIGVMNIMLVTVTERTSEIGLKKAIGAKKKSILGQFLTEAAVLTSLGGIIGVVAGIIMAEVISRMADIPVAVSVPAIIIAVFFSMLIGIVFGLLPSVQAANLNPIDALRHE